jgi:hypothetical protein
VVTQEDAYWQVNAPNNEGIPGCGMFVVAVTTDVALTSMFCGWSRNSPEAGPK